MTCQDCICHDMCEKQEKLMLTVNNLYELMYQYGVDVSCKRFKSKGAIHNG